MVPGKRRRLGLGVGCVLLCVASCGSQSVCSSAGSVSSVAVHFDSSLPVSSIGSAHICVEQTCSSFSASSITDGDGLYALWPTLTGPGTHSVSVDLRDKAGNLMLSGKAASVATEAITPNGPGCGPTSYRLSVSFRDGRLSVAG